MWEIWDLNGLGDVDKIDLPENNIVAANKCNKIM